MDAERVSGDGGRATGAGSRSRSWVLFTALALALLLSELDQAIFATALPTVVGELGGVEDMLWVNTVYMLTGTITLPLYGHLSDRFGRRPLLVSGLLVFLAGSVVGGLAPDIGTLIAARAVQGLGAGGMIILVQAVVADVVPARERAPYLSAIGAVFAVAALVGPLVGGWLTDGAGWRWAFWLNLPVGGLALLAVLLLLREPSRPRTQGRADVGGVSTLALTIAAGVLLASWGGTRYAWSSAPVLALAVATVAGAALFVAAERRAEAPVIPLGLFADRTFTAAVVAGLALAVAMFGTVGYLPTYLQMVTGLTPTGAGLAMLTLITGLALSTVVAAQVVRRTGRYRALPLLGAGLTATALTLLAGLTPATPLWQSGGYLFLLGLGIGFAWEVLVVAVQNSAPDAAVGSATAANSFFREIGILLGSAVVGGLFTARLGALLVERVPGTAVPSADLQSLTPALVRTLPPEVRRAVAGAYNDALTPVFALLVPVVLVAVVALLALREVPLARTVAEADERPAEARRAV